MLQLSSKGDIREHHITQFHHYYPNPNIEDINTLEALGHMFRTDHKFQRNTL